MATVGQQLTAPEAGWKRFDDTSPSITYLGTWVTHTDPSLNNGTHHVSYDANAVIKFNFTGKKLRLICTKNSDRSPYDTIKIDGISYQYCEGNGAPVIFKILLFEKLDLSSTEHTVEIMHYNDSNAFTLDAIDIDENGALKPYSPIEDTLLRVTMLDSSERDYQLTTTEVNGFVNWFNSHTSTNTTSYMLNKKVGTQNSKEYLSFDKIISFEVMELK